MNTQNKPQKIQIIVDDKGTEIVIVYPDPKHGSTIQSMVMRTSRMSDNMSKIAKEIFQFLKKYPQPNGYVVLHNLGLAQEFNCSQETIILRLNELEYHGYIQKTYHNTETGIERRIYILETPYQEIK